MPVVDGRPSGRKPITPETIAAMPDGPIKSLMLTAPPRHDYPACAVFRGGKCTCDEASSARAAGDDPQPQGEPK